PTTGLGLSPPNPIRLAQRLEKFFGDSGTSKNSCSCTCGSTPGSTSESCCCLACKDCSESCNSECVSRGSSGSQCSCASKLSQCPRKTFCEAINGIKIPAQAGDRTCCESGQKCHCGLGSGSNCNSGNCCIEKVGNSTYKHSLKCLLRRVVKFFSNLSLDPNSSQPNRSRICCELVCVVKTCYFIKDFYNKKNLDECSKCKKGGKTCPKSGKCCAGPTPNCGSSPCSSCDECQKICNAKKFFNELQTLQYSGPCGHELYRLIDGFLQGCVFPVAGLNDNDVAKKAVQTAQEKCSKCQNASKSGTSSPCDCSSTSSCPACTSLLKDPSLKTLFNPEYVSSYVNSTWESLCKSGSKCCGSSSPPSCKCPQTCSPGSSCPSQCCPDCPQRKAAKIFLGMLPCLYWGLKIVYDRCKYDSGFAGWNLAKIPEASGLRDFLTAWGYDVHPLKSKNASDLPPILDILYGSGKFKSLFDFVSKEYFSIHVFTSDPSKSQDPLTVRSMLLWLYGLPFTSGFHDLVLHCSSLCLPFGNSFHPDAFCYYLHVSCFLLPVSVISVIQLPDGSPSFLPSPSDWKDFSYPSDTLELFENFCDFVRKVYIPLNFLRYQCERITEQAGWMDCYFAKTCVTALENSLSTPAPVSATSCCKSSGPYGILCTSIPGHSNYHEHCISSNPKVKCIGLKPCTDSTEESSKKTAKDAHSQGKCTASCPHPLLMFLIDGSLGSDPGKSYSLFKLPDDSSVPPMGFSKDHLPATAKSGESLLGILEPFCTGDSSLTSLVQFLNCISRTPPETLGEFFLFFKKLAEALDSTSDLSSKFVEWIEGEPGFYPPTMLKTALEKLFNSGSHSSGDHSVASLYSLNDCEGPKGSSPPHPTCGKYLHPLAQDASDNLAEDLVDTYLSWVCYLTPKFKTLLEEFRGKFSSCCSSCQNIVKCPCALATLYSQGFVYYSPSGLGCWDSWGQEHFGRGNTPKHSGGDGAPGCTRKTCQNFITQLGKVLQADAPLDLLIKQIESFLWSIRFPFFLFILAFWAFVISYFLYVQLY
ncbi:variant erythrocyte surface antigen-1 family protein, partial [Babesia divergens]